MPAAPDQHATLASPPWSAWADTVFATQTHLGRRFPSGLTPWHLKFFDELDQCVELALSDVQLYRLDELAQLFFTAAVHQDMAHVNEMLDVYRALKLHSLQLSEDRPESRVRRALFRELWHLVRRRIQALLGRTVRPDTTVLHSVGSPEGHPYQAWCDGSFRQGIGYAGFLVQDSQGTTIAEASLRVSARASHDTEVQSLRLVLATALAFGVHELRVHVDAAGLANYAKGTAALKDCVQESCILQLMAKFSFLELIKVPRLFNGRADALARQLKS